jgi:hypothetical protein
MYAEWDPDNETFAGISRANDVAELRATSKLHRILSVAEAVDRVSAGEMLNLSPLCGGLPPELAWPYLKRVGDTVLPEAARASGASASGDSLGDALNVLLTCTTIRSISTSTTIPIRSGSGCATTLLSTTTRSSTSMH